MQSSPRITRLGLAALKGTRHVDLDQIDVDAHGPVGDRQFCLVDPATNRVLRSVENPSLTRLVVRVSGDLMSVALPDGQVVEASTRDRDGGEQVSDYWGRGARLTLQDCSLTSIFAEVAGREVTLARADRGDVIYYDAVSLVTTGALARLAAAVEADGYAVPSALDARFRATATLELDVDPAPGTRLRLGTATVEVTQALERCAVVDIDPATGRRDDRLLPHLVSGDGRLLFGVGAVVVRPGRVSVQP